MKEESETSFNFKTNQNGKDYMIDYFDSSRMYFYKRISRIIENPDVSGFGHYVTDSLFIGRDHETYFLTIYHDEIKSSKHGMPHLITENTKEENKTCNEMIVEFFQILINFPYTGESSYESLINATEIYNDICNAYFLKDRLVKTKIK